MSGTLQIYDGASEMWRAVTEADVAYLRQLIWAYGRIREACAFVDQAGESTVPLALLENIHAELQRRLAA
jgi:hypothetical protein